jgi:hypothetical protein
LLVIFIRINPKRLNKVTSVVAYRLVFIRVNLKIRIPALQHLLLLELLKEYNNRIQQGKDVLIVSLCHRFIECRAKCIKTIIQRIAKVGFEQLRVATVAVWANGSLH